MELKLIHLSLNLKVALLLGYVENRAQDLHIWHTKFKWYKVCSQYYNLHMDSECDTNYVHIQKEYKLPHAQMSKSVFVMLKFSHVN